MSRYPKVLIGVPTYSRKEYTRKIFIDAVNKITYPNYDLLIVDSSKGTSYTSKLRKEGLRVVHLHRGNKGGRQMLRDAENLLVERMIAGNYDYIFMLESDVIVHPTVIQDLMSHMDTQRLDLRHGRRVVGFPYLLTKETLCIAQVATDENTGVMGCKYIHGEENIRKFMFKGLQKVHAMGVGCALIHKSIFTQNLPGTDRPIRFWYSSIDDERLKESQVKKYPDSYFYMDLHNKGIPVYADSNTCVGHNPSDNTKIKQ